MPKLAPNAIRAASVLPKTITFPILGGVLHGGADQLVLPVREATLVLVGTVAQLRKCLA